VTFLLTDMVSSTRLWERYPEEMQRASYNFETGPVPIGELPGLSVFFKDEEGNIFHTYSTYARGLDIFLGTYNLLDIVPKGRDEEGMRGMEWLRHHDRYDDPKPFVHPWEEKKAAASV